MITVLENLVHTEGNRDIEIAGDERGMYAYAITGDTSLLETGKTYTYSITFRGKKGGYADISVDGNSTGSRMMVEHTGEVQRVHFTIVRAETTARGVYLVRRGNNNYEVGESVRLISISVHEGTQGSDIYTPPHAELTQEQIAMMKYGEFEEIETI